MNRLQLKRALIALLERARPDTLAQDLKAYSPQDLINPLFTCLCHASETVRWHAVTAFGWTVAAIAAQDLERARVIMRRCLWMLNEESGGIGWGVPEVLGEVMFRQERLAGEYLHLLVSYTLDDGPELFQDGNFMELPQLQEGVLWGLCRLAPSYPDRLRECRVQDNLGVYFDSENGQVRGLACHLGALLNLGRFRADFTALAADQHRTRVYLDGVFHDRSVGFFARQALYNLAGSR